MSPAAPKKQIGRTVAEILTRGRPPFVVIDFPRYDATGEPIARVHMRLLTIAEEQLALAQARTNCARLTKDASEYKSDLTDLEHNERMAEIIAIAARRDDDPSQAFFEAGRLEVDQFTSDEIGVLVAAYARLKDENPRVDQLSQADFEEAIKVLEKGLESFPFSSWPRLMLDRFTERCVRFLASGQSLNTSTTNGSSPSQPSGSDVELETREKASHWLQRLSSTSRWAASTRSRARSVRSLRVLSVSPRARCKPRTRRLALA